MTTSRKKIPLATQTKVLTRSKRRCCLCVGLHGDFGIKQLQIAHIDGNRNNNSEENLVTLCLLHHDEYDRTPSQSKGLTSGELKKYRADLDKIVLQIDERLKIPDTKTSSSEEITFLTPSARLIGKILTAYDREITTLDAGSSPNGVALSRLSAVALLEEGDLDATVEAIMGITRILHQMRERGLPQQTVQERADGKLTDKLETKLPSEEAYPQLTAHKSLSNTLFLVANTDLPLFRSVLGKMKQYAFIGDSSRDALLVYKDLPFGGFGAVTTILVGLCYRFADTGHSEAERETAVTLMDLLLGLSYVLGKTGIELPVEPTMAVGLGGERWITVDQRAELYPLVSLAHAVARLPINSFNYALESLRYGFRLVILKSKAPKFNAYTLETQLTTLRQAAALRSHAIYLMSFDDEVTEAKFDEELNRIVEEGNKCLKTLVVYIMKERKLFPDNAKV